MGDEEPQLPLLNLREGTPPLVMTAVELAEVVRRLQAGTGPIALDAERASGYRYSQRAYLLQLRRAGSGTALIDPIRCADLTPLAQTLNQAEWVLHAATQDLPCLAELSLRPQALFDTELAGRLLGRDRVGLAALVASELGMHLAKGHGAADWSQRPLAPELLQYAALDVELLLELRDILAEALVEQQRWEWAEQEFAALCSFQPKGRGEEPWRRTSGIHRVRKPRALAVVRSLWHTRDGLAARLDQAPGRVLPDAAIIAAAQAMPASSDDLGALPEFSGRGQQRRLTTWWAALATAMALPAADLPASAPEAEGPPPPRQWADRHPVAAARLAAARAAIVDRSVALGIAAEVLISPDLVRRYCWEPPDPSQTKAFLATAGARPWQVEQV
ncbi:MAG: HRDC domain-containing protein, partial [Actinomycetales bacterium]